MKPTDIIYCKNCKHIVCQKQAKGALLYSCKKESHCFAIDQPELYCNKSCFCKRLIKTKAQES